MAALNLRVTYHVKPGMRDAFIKALQECGVQQDIRNEDGCVAYDYFLSIEDENVVVLIEEWESKAQQEVHLGQPHMAKVHDLKDRFVEDMTLEEF